MLISSLLASTPSGLTAPLCWLQGGAKSPTRLFIHFSFLLGITELSLPLPGCGETKVHGCGRQDAVAIQFLFGVINNSDCYKRYHFIIVAKHSGILTDLPGGFDSGISWVPVDIMHFTVGETLCTCESLQPCDERAQLCPGRPLKAVLIPSAPWDLSGQKSPCKTPLSSCEYWMLFKNV